MRQDVIIVGAPRSGTNVLRDVLTRVDGVTSWPCDEINLVWRHGNRDFPSDELRSDHATPRVRQYLRGQFDRICRKQDAHTVVEKTCATSLRVGFTRQIFPEAKYVFITRDGVDCAASAVERWHAPLDVRYTAAKARFVPASDLPYYGLRFVRDQLRRRRGTDGSVRTWWGPKPHDYRELMEQRPLDEICMIQWQRCVEEAQRGLSGLPSSQLFDVSYEEFVTRPVHILRDLLGFLDVPAPRDLPGAVSEVSSSSVGRGRKKLSEERFTRLEALAGPTLRGLGYVG